MKKNKVKDQFLSELKKVPIIQVAAEKTNVSRNSIYRWKEEDKQFAEDLEKALAEGEALINDISESQLLTLIKEKNWQAISFWLKHRNSKFREKVEVTTKTEKDEALTPEQELLVKKALQLASLVPEDNQ